MATKNTNYVPSLAEELVPEVNKQIDADTKALKSHFDGLLQGEKDRRNTGVKNQIDNFIASTKGIAKGVEEIQTIADTIKNDNEYLNPQAAKDYEKWEHQIGLLSQAGGNMKALGKAELEDPNGDVDVGVKLIQGDRPRLSAQKTLTNGAVDFSPFK